MTGSSLLQRGLSQAYHEGSLVWLPQIETVNSLSADGSKKKVTNWRRGTVNVSSAALSLSKIAASRAKADVLYIYKAAWYSQQLFSILIQV
jgi:hypothetical protein